jgi:hypothetical protein
MRREDYCVFAGRGEKKARLWAGLGPPHVEVRDMGPERNPMRTEKITQITTLRTDGSGAVVEYGGGACVKKSSENL